MEMRSTPVSARARTVSSSPRRKFPAPRAPGVATHRFVQGGKGSMLSSSTMVAPQASASSSCSRVSTSISTNGPAAPFLHPLQHGGHATGGGDVVFLDQHRVVQADAVVHAAAGGHRVLLGQPQAGQGLAGVHDARPGAGHGLHVHWRSWWPRRSAAAENSAPCVRRSAGAGPGPRSPAPPGRPAQRWPSATCQVRRACGSQASTVASPRGRHRSRPPRAPECAPGPPVPSTSAAVRSPVPTSSARRGPHRPGPAARSARSL
jgi:hypothetical protein